MSGSEDRPAGPIQDGRWHHYAIRLNLETGESETWVDGEKVPPALRIYRYDPTIDAGPYLFSDFRWPSKEALEEAERGGRCFTCLDTGRVAEQTGLDSFTSAPCPDCSLGGTVDR